MSPLVRFGNTLGAAGLAFVLVLAFAFQFALHELPCPLCILQRIAFALCGLGFVLNLRFGVQPNHYGLILLSALFGLAVSGRQILLHIVPGTGSYGSAILGLHFYSWAFILFLLIIGGVAVLLMLSGSGRFDYSRSDALAAARFVGLPRLMAYVLTVMVFASAVATFAQCGPIECADDPKSYWIVPYLPAFMR